MVLHDYSGASRGVEMRSSNSETSGTASSSRRKRSSSSRLLDYTAQRANTDLLRQPTQRLLTRRTSATGSTEFLEKQRRLSLIRRSSLGDIPSGSQSKTNRAAPAVDDDDGDGNDDSRENQRRQSSLISSHLSPLNSDGNQSKLLDKGKDNTPASPGDEEKKSCSYTTTFNGAPIREKSIFLGGASRLRHPAEFLSNSDSSIMVIDDSNILQKNQHPQILQQQEFLSNSDSSCMVIDSTKNRLQKEQQHSPKAKQQQQDQTNHATTNMRIRFRRRDSWHASSLQSAPLYIDTDNSGEMHQTSMTKRSHRASSSTLQRQVQLQLHLDETQPQQPLPQKQLPQQHQPQHQPSGRECFQQLVQEEARKMELEQQQRRKSSKHRRRSIAGDSAPSSRIPRPSSSGNLLQQAPMPMSPAPEHARRTGRYDDTNAARRQPRSRPAKTKSMPTTMVGAASHQEDRHKSRLVVSDYGDKHHKHRRANKAAKQERERRRSRDLETVSIPGPAITVVTDDAHGHANVRGENDHMTKNAKVPEHQKGIDSGSTHTTATDEGNPIQKNAAKDASPTTRHESSLHSKASTHSRCSSLHSKNSLDNSIHPEDIFPQLRTNEREDGGAYGFNRRFSAPLAVVALEMDNAAGNGNWANSYGKRPTGNFPARSKSLNLVANTMAHPPPEPPRNFIDLVNAASYASSNHTGSSSRRSNGSNEQLEYEDHAPTRRSASPACRISTRRPSNQCEYEEHAPTPRQQNYGSRRGSIAMSNLQSDDCEYEEHAPSPRQGYSGSRRGSIAAYVPFGNLSPIRRTRTSPVRKTTKAIPRRTQSLNVAMPRIVVECQAKYNASVSEMLERSLSQEDLFPQLRVNGDDDDDEEIEESNGRQSVAACLPIRRNSLAAVEHRQTLFNRSSSGNRRAPCRSKSLNLVAMSTFRAKAPKDDRYQAAWQAEYKARANRRGSIAACLAPEDAFTNGNLDDDNGTKRRLTAKSSLLRLPRRTKSLGEKSAKAFCFVEANAANASLSEVCNRSMNAEDVFPELKRVAETVSTIPAAEFQEDPSELEPLSAVDDAPATNADSIPVEAVPNIEKRTRRRQSIAECTTVEIEKWGAGKMPRRRHSIAVCVSNIVHPSTRPARRFPCRSRSHDGTWLDHLAHVAASKKVGNFASMSTISGCSLWTSVSKETGASHTDSTTTSDSNLDAASMCVGALAVDRSSSNLLMFEDASCSYLEHSSTTWWNDARMPSSGDGRAAMRSSLERNRNQSVKVNVEEHRLDASPSYVTSGRKPMPRAISHDNSFYQSMPVLDEVQEHTDDLDSSGGEDATSEVIQVSGHSCATSVGRGVPPRTTISAEEQFRSFNSIAELQDHCPSHNNVGPSRGGPLPAPRQPGRGAIPPRVSSRGPEYFLALSVVAAAQDRRLRFDSAPPRQRKGMPPRMQSKDTRHFQSYPTVMAAQQHQPGEIDTSPAFGMPSTAPVKKPERRGMPPRCERRSPQHFQSIPAVVVLHQKQLLSETTTSHVSNLSRLLKRGPPPRCQSQSSEHFQGIPTVVALQRQPRRQSGIKPVEFATFMPRAANALSRRGLPPRCQSKTPDYFCSIPVVVQARRSSNESLTSATSALSNCSKPRTKRSMPPRSSSKHSDYFLAFEVVAAAVQGLEIPRSTDVPSRERRGIPPRCQSHDSNHFLSFDILAAAGAPVGTNDSAYTSQKGRGVPPSFDRRTPSYFESLRTVASAHARPVSAVETREPRQKQRHGIPPKSERHDSNYFQSFSVVSKAGTPDTGKRSSIPAPPSQSSRRKGMPPRSASPTSAAPNSVSAVIRVKQEKSQRAGLLKAVMPSTSGVRRVGKYPRSRSLEMVGSSMSVAAVIPPASGTDGSKGYRRTGKPPRSRSLEFSGSSMSVAAVIRPQDERLQQGQYSSASLTLNGSAALLNQRNPEPAPRVRKPDPVPRVTKSASLLPPLAMPGDLDEDEEEEDAFGDRSLLRKKPAPHNPRLAPKHNAELQGTQQFFEFRRGTSVGGTASSQGSKARGAMMLKKASSIRTLPQKYSTDMISSPTASVDAVDKSFNRSNSYHSRLNPRHAPLLPRRSPLSQKSPRRMEQPPAGITMNRRGRMQKAISLRNFSKSINLGGGGKS